MPRFERIENIPAAREAAKLDRDSLGLERLEAAGTVSVSERTSLGRDGDPDITLIVIRPNSASAAPIPALYYTHGGGMVRGDARTITGEHSDWLVRFGCALVSVEYRLAPETPDTGPVEDSYAGLVWTAAHAHQLGIDVDKIIVMGRSAGGGLAAGITLLARDRVDRKWRRKC